MQVLEAAELLVEIVMECKELAGCAFMLMPPKPQILLAEGYKIHITSDIGTDRNMFVCIENIAVKQGLSLFEDARGIMVYRKH